MTKPSPLVSEPPTPHQLEKAVMDIKPSDFMKMRRPELYSDTAVLTEPAISKDVFSLHLDTLTNQKQETEFEHFCRRLAEKEICPNLLPQTGPTGGGDSKVDTETYPVSEEIALRWYIGHEAAQEQWAFAVSAKKDWKPKVKSDVAKIVKTGRGYKRIYFITNQYTPDKSRAEIQDNLTREHGIPVQILDRSWIIEKIFENKRFEIAIETLRVSFNTSSRQMPGPIDTRREAELRELDAQIDNVARYKGVQYQLAEDALQSAILARGLGRTRNEIEGRFVRAERVATQVGHSQQRLRIAYTKAWTYYWWFDDVQALNEHYDEISSLSLRSYETSDVEMLVNVWQLLKAHIRHGKINIDSKKWNEQTEQLTSHLDKLACDKERPNNGLFAYSLRLLIDLNNAIESLSGIDEVLKKFKNTLEAGNSLGNYPLEPFAEIVMELGEVLPDNKSYDDLFETLVAIVEKRRSEGEGGKELLRRGYQKLRASKNYDAIRLLGRAQEKLIKQEYRGELVAALVGCALAYEQAGLLWAARTNMLSALAQAFLVYTQEGLLIPSALNSLKKLTWLELQLGRVPHVLNFIEAADATASRLQLDKPLFEKYLKEREQQDAILGILLLKSPLVDLQQLGRLPGALEELQLPAATMAMLYALGEEYPRKEGWVPKGVNDKAVPDFFLQWLDQPAADQITGQAEFLLTPTVTLRSSILGCEVICISQNNLESIQLSEIILGALESLLATSLDAPIFPYRQKLTIYISPDKDNSDLPQLKIDDASGESTILIGHASDAPSPTQEKRKEFRIRLMQIVSQILPYIFVVKDEEKFIARLAGEESAFSRAFDFCEIAIIIKNILGEAPKFRSSDWLQDEKETNFELQRTSVWHEGIKPIEEKPKTESLWSKKMGSGEAPEELRNVERLKHQDRKIYSPIDIPLWDKAKWSATAYGFSPGVAPLLMIGYKNAEAAQSIFRGWLTQIGKLDNNNLIRVSILTGVSQKNPAAYTVIIGSDPTVNANFQGEAVLVSRINHMVPRTTQNLDNFLKQWEQSKRYVLIPAHFVDERTMPTLFTELGIGKTHLSVRPAWQVGENDPDSCGLLEEDEPIIPEDVKDAPVLKALERIRKRRKQGRG